jgi:hypothetical protein
VKAKLGVVAVDLGWLMVMRACMLQLQIDEEPIGSLLHY